MLTKKQLSIFGIFAGNTFKEYTFKELKEFTKEKSHSVLQNAIQKFLKEKLITERKIGTSKLYSINQDNNKAYDYLTLFSIEKLPDLAKKSITILQKEIEKEEHFYSTVVFGSYAQGTFHQKSDLDIAVFIHDKKSKKKIAIAINTAQNKSLLNLDCHAITESEFLEMIKAPYENLGKEIARKNLPIHNTIIFYSLLKKGVEHGFKIIS